MDTIESNHIVEWTNQLPYLLVAHLTEHIYFLRDWEMGKFLCEIIAIHRCDSIVLQKFIKKGLFSLLRVLWFL